MAATNNPRAAEIARLQSQTGLSSNFSLFDLRTAFFGGKVSQNDAIKAYLQTQTGLTGNQSLGDLWRQYFIGKGVTNQTSLTDMARDFFVNVGFSASTPDPVYGLSFDGGDKIVISDHANLDQANFRIEFWIKFGSTFTGGVADQFLIHRDPPIQVFFNTSGNLRFAVNDAAGSWHEIGSSKASWAGGQWFHVSLNCNGNTLSIYVDGAEQANNVGIQDAGGANVSNQNLTIGAKTDGSQGIVATIDEFIFAKNPRTGAFTPPTGEYTVDANTVFLLHMDENTGTTTDNAEGTAALDPTFGATTAAPTWVAGKF